MELKLIRRVFTKRTTLSRLYINGLYETNVLEDCVRDKKIPHVTAIPYGKYFVTIDYSNRFKRNMIHILNVPDYEGIRIHSGNTSEDTDGCLIVGDTIINNDYIVGSRDALRRLENKIQSAIDSGENVTIEIMKSCDNGFIS